MSCSSPNTFGHEGLARSLLGCGQCFECLLSDRGRQMIALEFERRETALDTLTLFSTVTVSEEFLSENGYPFSSTNLSHENQKIFDTYVEKMIIAMQRRQDRYCKREGLPKRKIRHYSSVDFGGKWGRIHGHQILFGVMPQILNPHWLSVGDRQVCIVGEEIAWPCGQVMLFEATRGMFQYVGGHGLKSLGLKSRLRTSRSRHPTIGGVHIRKIIRDEIEKQSNALVRHPAGGWTKTPAKRPSVMLPSHCFVGERPLPFTLTRSLLNYARDEAEKHGKIIITNPNVGQYFDYLCEKEHETADDRYRYVQRDNWRKYHPEETMMLKKIKTTKVIERKAGRL